jgi:hypothetical protein
VFGQILRLLMGVKSFVREISVGNTDDTNVVLKRHGHPQDIQEEMKTLYDKVVC